jgi:hypothetical protein
MKLLGLMGVGFGITDEIYFCISEAREKSGSAMRQYNSS